MALTRKFLKALGLEDDKIDEIITAHGDTVTALKEEIEKAKQEAEGLDAVKKERDRYKQDYEALQKTSGDAAKVQAEFDAYKQEVAEAKLSAQRDAAFDSIAMEAGVERPAFRAALRKIYDMSRLDMVDSGNAKNRADIVKQIQTEHKDFVGKVNTNGTPPVTPPPGGNVKTYTREQLKSLTPDEINQNWGAVSAALKGE